MLILGIDPGSLHTGYGLLEKSGSTLRAVELGRFSCPRDLPLPVRRSHLAGRLEELVRARRPDLAVLETPFHGVNSRSLVILAEARGALLAVLGGLGIEVREYSPAEVKSAVAGNGRADKEQVARMLRLTVALDPGIRYAGDATDALAVAVCGAQRLRLDALAVR